VNGYEVSIENGQQFMTWAVDFFAGSAHISFEGIFALDSFATTWGATTESNDILKRNTLAPKTNFLVLPLEQETKEVITRTVLPQIGLRRNVHHIQIEKDGQLVLGVYDSLQHCWIAGRIQAADLESLKASGVVRSFREH
jgi:hypothetical protein